MTERKAGYHWVCISHENGKIYRHMAFLPQPGDLIKISVPDEAAMSLKVDSVIFEDGEIDEFICEPSLLCSRVE